MTSEPGSLPSVTVQADRNACIGTGECWRVAPRAFDTDEEGTVLVLDTATSVELELLRRAERSCPVAAITVTEL
jgi:ferredoxin